MCSLCKHDNQKFNRSLWKKDYLWDKKVENRTQQYKTFNFVPFSISFRLKNLIVSKRWSKSRTIVCLKSGKWTATIVKFKICFSFYIISPTLSNCSLTKKCYNTPNCSQNLPIILPAVFTLVRLFRARQLAVLQSCVLFKQPERRKVCHANVTFEFIGVDQHRRHRGSGNRSRSFLGQQFRLGTGFDLGRRTTVVFGKIDLRRGRGCLLFGWYQFGFMDVISVIALAALLIRIYFEQFNGWLCVKIRVRSWSRRHSEEVAILEKLFGQQGLLVQQVKDPIWIDRGVPVVLRCVKQTHAERERREGEVEGHRGH